MIVMCLSLASLVFSVAVLVYVTHAIEVMEIREAARRDNEYMRERMEEVVKGIHERAKR